VRWTTPASTPGREATFRPSRCPYRRALTLARRSRTRGDSVKLRIPWWARRFTAWILNRLYDLNNNRRTSLRERKTQLTPRIKVPRV
jgi:hypothetical protein